MNRWMFRRESNETVGDGQHEAGRTGLPLPTVLCLDLNIFILVKQCHVFVLSRGSSYEVVSVNAEPSSSTRDIPRSSVLGKQWCNRLLLLIVLSCSKR